ncbi:MAG: class I SAM-dependent methyltransferase [Caldilineaceae bacterium]|nr:class I SAM-dependent methyltransferase [Caldilineaceae bacterium]
MSIENLMAADCASIEHPNNQADSSPAVPVIDYEGSGYRQDFWEGQGREYEDAVERIALRRLLPPRGGRIAEIGAGFGRLADLYLGYEQIVLFDYSRTMLSDAVRRWGDDKRFVFVAGNLYQMPLADQSLDTLVMVRVMHHLADIPAALARLQALLHQDSTAVLEYASKRNLKAVLRWLTRRQSWSPFDPAPLEFVAMNFDFHPGWMGAKLKDAGLNVHQRYGASHFRLRTLKRSLPAQALARVDSWLFGIGGRFPLAPSVFVQTHAPDAPGRRQTEASAAHSKLFRCPACGAHPLSALSPVELQCPSCARKYVQRESIWDFKLPA